MNIKVVDKKGRVVVGNTLAGRMVIINDADPERIIITPAVAIPEREAWLYENKEALDRVRKGLGQARRREFSKTPPDLDADVCLTKEIPD